MPTNLNLFRDAYASLTVAVYEPLILRWVSQLGLHITADVIARRARISGEFTGVPTLAVIASATAARDRARSATAAAAVLDSGRIGVGPEPGTAEVAEEGGGAAHQARRLEVHGFPNAVALDGRVYFHGVADEADLRAAAQSGVGMRARVPLLVQGLSEPEAERDLAAARREIFDALRQEAIQDPSLVRLVDVLGGLGHPSFHPPAAPMESLAPLGIAHLYRQLYFAGVEGVGPIEEAFTIAPNETLEILAETVRRQVHEEIFEVGFESVSETAQELRNQDEISDKVSSMIQRDSSAAFSAEGGTNFAVWHAGASASASLSTSTQQSRESARRRLRELTTSASQRLTRSVTVRRRDSTEITTTASTRRVIQNVGNVPVSYGLRRVLRRVHVRVQDLGPRLVWQLYVRNPGLGLARSRFVLFRAATDVAPPDTPPDMEPRPQGGVDTGSTQAAVTWMSDHHEAAITITTSPDRRITSVTIDSIVDLGGDTKDSDEPAPLGINPLLDTAASDNVFSARFRMKKGKSDAISVTYSYTFEPTHAVLDEWEGRKRTKLAALLEEKLQEQFERQRTLITQRSRIRTRPARDLRIEERYEVMNRMVSHLFGRQLELDAPSPLEIEYFHRYFEIDGIFTYLHPSWWRPRYTTSRSALGRKPYEVTDESEPAPLGSSLGWCLQDDGDERRNQFLNSPWVRVCVPIRRTREREAAEWLARHVEGTIGFERQEVTDLLAAVEAVRASENGVAAPGAEWAVVGGTGAVSGSDPERLSPQAVYPIVEEFDVTVPTDGFVYDELQIAIT